MSIVGMTTSEAMKLVDAIRGTRRAALWHRVKSDQSPEPLGIFSNRPNGRQLYLSSVGENHPFVVHGERFAFGRAGGRASPFPLHSEL